MINEKGKIRAKFYLIALLRKKGYSELEIGDILANSYLFSEV